ncbi:MAG: ABC transporter ATP-binding protein [Gammaproteobacteria bacterium]
MINNQDFAYYLRDLSYRYDNDFKLQISDLGIKKNQITTLIGSNGSGKSTLLNLLAFLQIPDHGELTFFGQKLTNKLDQKSALSLRREVALVSQNPYLLKGTVEENITLGLRFRGQTKQDQKTQIDQVLEKVGIKGFQDRNVKELSGGEAQKVSLARALILQPKVFLLDEPFTHLDQKSVETLESLLRSLVKDQNMTVVLSTHDQLQGMALSEEVISLMNGRIVNAPLLNLFHGYVDRQQDEHLFKTEKISINLPNDISDGKHIVIDPIEIVLSNGSLNSSMRNSFQGRVIAIAEDKGRVWVTVEAGEKFQVQITQESLQEMSLNLGSIIWLNFKSTSVRVF